MDLGSTMEARDFVERFPLDRVSAGLVRWCGYVRLFPLEGGQIVLHLVILRVLEADIIIDAGSFLFIN